MEFVAEIPQISQKHIQSWSIGPDSVLKNRVIDDVIHFLSQRFTMGPSVLFKYRLCLDESITNAITHGCKGLDNAEVKVDFYWSENRWAIRVVDPGQGFDGSDVPDLSDPSNEYKEHGRGILILERYTDQLVFAKNGCEQVFWMDTTDLS